MKSKKIKTEIKILNELNRSTLKDENGLPKRICKAKYLSALTGMNQQRLANSILRKLNEENLIESIRDNRWKTGYRITKKGIEYLYENGGPIPSERDRLRKVYFDHKEKIDERIEENLRDFGVMEIDFEESYQNILRHYPNRSKNLLEILTNKFDDLGYVVDVTLTRKDKFNITDLHKIGEIMLRYVSYRENKTHENIKYWSRPTPGNHKK